jgi:RNA polymerase sigma factor (sigma-70 family)
MSDTDEFLPTRVTLLNRLKDHGNHASWQEFFDLYWKLIYSVARKAGLTDAESQDVVQETMISVSKHMPGFVYDAVNGSFKKWLLNMTRWRITDQLRRRMNQHAHAPSQEDTLTRELTIEAVMDPASNALDALWETEWQQNLLDAAMARVKRRVDPRTYQLFDFYVNKGWEPDKVAATFSVTANQVYIAKTRITDMLKAEVAKIERPE